MYHLCSQGSKIQPSCISDTWSGETQTKEVCENIREARRSNRYRKQKQTWGWDWHRTKLRFSHSNTQVKCWTKTWKKVRGFLWISTPKVKYWKREKAIPDIWRRGSSDGGDQAGLKIKIKIKQVSFLIFPSKPNKFLFKFNQSINQSGPTARLSEV